MGPELVRYRIKLTQFLVQYRTELVDAVMPMMALVFLMPMPSYVSLYKFSRPVACCVHGAVRSYVKQLALFCFVMTILNAWAMPS